MEEVPGCTLALAVSLNEQIVTTREGDIQSRNDFTTDRMLKFLGKEGIPRTRGAMSAYPRAALVLRTL
jgi:hypothetical protein